LSAHPYELALRGQRRKAETDHLVEGRLRILLEFHDQVRMAESEASGVDETCRKGRVSQRKLAGRHATRDDLLQNRSHAFIMPPHDRPFLAYRRVNQIVQLTVEHILFVVGLFDRPDQVAYSLRSVAAGRHNFSRLRLDPAKEDRADSLVDFRFRREIAIDVGRRHRVRYRQPSSSGIRFAGTGVPLSRQSAYDYPFWIRPASFDQTAAHQRNHSLGAGFAHSPNLRQVLSCLIFPGAYR
jgi:hypothetical protein